MLHLSSDISVGSRWASGWLFKKGWKERIIEKLREYSRNPNLFDFNQFVDYVFSSDFKSDCKGKGIDLVTLVSNGMHMKDVDNSLGKKIGDISNIIGIFVDTIASLFHSRKEICKSGSVITPNIIFTQKLFLEKIGGFLVLASVSSSQYLKAMYEILSRTKEISRCQSNGFRLQKNDDFPKTLNPAILKKL